MTAIHEEEAERAPARADPSIMIFLALFTLLLAFFILLNSVATREASRSAALMRSLGATFAGASKETISADPLELSRDALRAEVGELLRRALPEAAAMPDERNGALRIVVPLSRLFREDLVEFHSRGEPLLAGLAELLSRRRNDGLLEAEVRIGFAPDERSDLAVRRAGAFAREAARLGVPARRLAVGLQAADPAAAELVLRLSPAREPPA